MAGTMLTVPLTVTPWWLVGHLADITDPNHAQLVRASPPGKSCRAFASARRRSRSPQLVAAMPATSIKHAAAFLRWLSEHGLDLSTCRPDDIDAWHVEHGRNTLRAFLQWCMTNKLTRRFRLPGAVIRQAAPLPQPERRDLLGRLLTGHGGRNASPSAVSAICRWERSNRVRPSSRSSRAIC